MVRERVRPIAHGDTGRKKRVRRSLGLMCAAMALPLAACSTGSSTDEGDDMNQAEARAHLEDVVRDVLASAAPDVEDGLSDTTEVPCGGLGGNEWNKVKYSLESSDGIQVADREASLEAVRALIEERGWELNPRSDAMGFSTGTVRGTAWVRASGVLVSAETECMDNDER